MLSVSPAREAGVRNGDDEFVVVPEGHPDG